MDSINSYVQQLNFSAKYYQNDTNRSVNNKSGGNMCLLYKQEIWNISKLVVPRQYLTYVHMLPM